MLLNQKMKKNAKQTLHGLAYAPGPRGPKIQARNITGCPAKEDKVVNEMPGCMITQENEK